MIVRVHGWWSVILLSFGGVFCDGGVVEVEVVYWWALVRVWYWCGGWVFVGVDDGGWGQIMLFGVGLVLGGWCFGWGGSGVA